MSNIRRINDPITLNDAELASIHGVGPVRSADRISTAHERTARWKENVKRAQDLAAFALFIAVMALIYIYGVDK